MDEDLAESSPESSAPSGATIGARNDGEATEASDRPDGGEGGGGAGNAADRVAPFKWKPGQSGNPGGRARGSGQKLILETFRQIVREDPRVLPSMVKAWIARSMQPGGAGYARIVFEMCDGKVPLPIKLAAQSGDEESLGELVLTVVQTPPLPEGANTPIEIEANPVVEDKPSGVDAEGEGPRE